MPKSILLSCTEGLQKLEEYGLFSGSQQVPTTNEERLVFVHFTNLTGNFLQLKFNNYTAAIPLQRNHIEFWRGMVNRSKKPTIPTLFPDEFDWNRMGRFLQWRQVLNAGGFTLTMVDSGRALSNIWLEDGSVDSETEFQVFLCHMCKCVEDN